MRSYVPMPSSLHQQELYEIWIAKGGDEENSYFLWKHLRCYPFELQDKVNAICHVDLNGKYNVMTLPAITTH